MAVSDKKKVQTLVNIMAEQAQICRAAVARMKTVREAFQLHNPDVTGTVLEGNVTNVNNALNTLDSAISGAVWTGLINAHVPSHEGKALS